MNYDIIVIGSGPGGYPAAIRAAQLGMKVAVVEVAAIGGICLNWGCIPTKTLMKSASVYRNALHASQYGVETGEVKADLPKMVARSRDVAAQMSKGIEFLFKKHNITLFQGRGYIKTTSTVEVTSTEGDKQTITGKHIIIATGSRPKELRGIPTDGVKVITSKEALILQNIPQTLAIVGSGAIGSELATFYSSIGSKVTLIEYSSHIVPLEDQEVGKLLERAFRKAKVTVMTDSAVTAVDTSGDGCTISVTTKKGRATVEADVVLLATGVWPNTENIGLEELGVKTDMGKIVVDSHYQSTVLGIYAIGDVIETPALAHVATAEGTRCVEYIAGLNSPEIDYRIIPSCVYTNPEISSVGLTEESAIEGGYSLRIGRFPYTASGKATSASERDGMVKLIFDADSDELLGAHLIGMNVTELIAEPTLAMQLGAKAVDLIRTIHPHPTMSESIMEAAAATHGEAIHL